MPNPKDTLSLVERLRERAAIARGEKTGTALGDAIHFEEAADEIERLTSQGGVPDWNDLPEADRTRLVTVGQQFAVEFHGGDAAVAMYNEVRKILSSLSAAPSPPVQQSRAVNVPGGQWKDISTAPRDGTRFLAWGPLWRCPFPAQFPDPVTTMVWIDTCEVEAKGRREYATHWMPLPAPPRPDDRTDEPINAAPKPEGE